MFIFHELLSDELEYDKNIAEKQSVASAKVSAYGLLQIRQFLNILKQLCYI